jgi:predicted MFS family arabinose efflux permease
MDLLLHAGHVDPWSIRPVPVSHQGAGDGVRQGTGRRSFAALRFGVFGGIVLGQGLGGVIARIGGITGPFWFAFVGSAVILALIWRQLPHIAHADDAARGS